MVFTRNDSFKKSQKPWLRLTLTMTNIFIMSDRAAFRDTFRIATSQKSKAELYTGKIASWTVEGFRLWNVFTKSSIFNAWLHSNSEQTLVRNTEILRPLFWSDFIFGKREKNDTRKKKKHKLDSAQPVCEKSPWPVEPVL